MRILAVAFGLGAVWLAAAGAASALTVQEAILRAKPGVALVTAEVRGEVTMNCGSGPVTVEPRPFIETGTGWFIDGSGWLITNAHVVDPAHRIPPWVEHELKKKAIDQACVEPILRERGIAPGTRPDMEDRLRREASDRALANAKLVTTPMLTVMLSNGEKLPAEVRKFSPPLVLNASSQPIKELSGRDLALLRVKDGNYPALSLTPRPVKIGDPVHILGFPGVVLTHELLTRSGGLEAVATSGAVSALGQKDAIGQDIIQTDAPASHGNSGGPAITNDSTVIGVLTFVSLSSSGSVVQGFNFLIPAADVQAFVAGTDVKPGASRFTDLWSAGLTALFAERYSTAVTRFKEANELVKGLADVKRALADAEELVKNPPPRPFPWAWITLAVTLLSAAGFGAIWVRRWWKSRFRILPTQVISLIEKGISPVMLDVRTATEFDTSPLKLPGAIRLAPEDASAGRIDLHVDPSQVIVAYCSSPEERTSAQVAQLLRQRGFKNVRILKNGLGGWTNARLPVETKSHVPISTVGLELYKNLAIGDVERRRFRSAETIFREGDDAHGEAYVLHAGTVEIRKRFDGEDRVLTKYAEGELFGELALFRNALRSADAVATSDVELLVIKNERLDWLIRNRPQLTIEVLRRLSDLIVRTDADRAHASLR